MIPVSPTSRWAWFDCWGSICAHDSVSRPGSKADTRLRGRATAGFGQIDAAVTQSLKGCQIWASAGGKFHLTGWGAHAVDALLRAGRVSVRRGNSALNPCTFRAQRTSLQYGCAAAAQGAAGRSRQPSRERRADSRNSLLQKRHARLRRAPNRLLLGAIWCPTIIMLVRFRCLVHRGLGF